MKAMNRLSQNLAYVIMSATLSRMPKFKSIAPIGESRQMGEILLSRGFDFFVTTIFARVPRENRRSDFDSV